VRARLPTGVEAEGSPQEVAELLRLLGKAESGPAEAPAPGPAVVERPGETDEPLACAVCGKVALTRRGLAHHRRFAHGGPRPKQRCGDCGREFDSASALGGHRRAHSGRDGRLDPGALAGPRADQSGGVGAERGRLGPDAKRMTIGLMVAARSALYLGVSVEDWAARNRFTGNVVLMRTIAGRIGELTDGPSWERMDAGGRERVVMAALGRSDRAEAALAGLVRRAG